MRAASLLGEQRLGQLRDGSTKARPTPPATDALTGVEAIATRISHTCAILEPAACAAGATTATASWVTGLQTRAPRPGPDVLPDVQAVTTGYWHTCALTQRGRGPLLGRNDLGQLGDGTTDNRSMPVPVAVCP
jgi:alpha-tubulin suppressor-like RCC1 family protein